MADFGDKLSSHRRQWWTDVIIPICESAVLVGVPRCGFTFNQWMGRKRPIPQEWRNRIKNRAEAVAAKTGVSTSGNRLSTLPKATEYAAELRLAAAQMSVAAGGPATPPPAGASSEPPPLLIGDNDMPGAAYPGYPPGYVPGGAPPVWTPATPAQGRTGIPWGPVVLVVGVAAAAGAAVWGARRFAQGTPSPVGASAAWGGDGYAAYSESWNGYADAGAGYWSY